MRQPTRLPRGAGARALAVDMAGHGLRARHPAALTRRPFDASLLASEPSPVADVGLDQAGELLVSQIEQLGAGDPAIVVAHSAGGAVLTRAAQQATALVAHAVYLTAFMPASGVPVSAYTRMPENEGGLVRSSLVIRPALQRRFIADADAAFPANPTSVHTLHASHSPFLSMPAQVAGIVLKLHR